MYRWKFVILIASLLLTAIMVTGALAAIPSGDLVDICTDLYGGVFGTPNG